ncbi:hypothetical protein HDV06_003413 [Boothiomyces sp. JEL0866]|nr:hypothetical protein HDV06_003365 [Boothiomyces sp. JEL0866]KAJ3325643.1 hypothetical protein HDV06_003413 [Boothiomyces sp. JEL0866]
MAIRKKKPTKAAKSRKKEPVYCSLCMESIESPDPSISCLSCKEIFHSTCVSSAKSFYCENCKPKSKANYGKKNISTLQKAKLIIDSSTEDDDICVLCEGECACNIPPKGRGKGKKFYGKKLRDLEELEDDESSEESETELPFDMENDRFWVKEEAVRSPEYESPEEESSAESVYEEPSGDDSQSDEDIMIEIVKDKLLNGWSSEEEVEEEFEEPFSPAPTEASIQEIIEENFVPVLVKEETKAPGVVETRKRKQEPVTPQTPQPKESKPIKVEVSEAKKRKTNPVTPQTPANQIPAQTTPSNITSATWYAIAAMNMNSSVLSNYQKPLTTPVKSDIPPQNMNAAAAANIASQLLKRPVNMNSVATAAAALIANPAAMKAFSELRRREMDKFTETMNLHAKIKAAAQAAVAAAGTTNQPKAVDSSKKQDLFSHPNMTRAVEELGKILQMQGTPVTDPQSSKAGTQKKAELKEEAIEDFLNELIDETEFDPQEPTSPQSEPDLNAEGYFSRFKKIPIGTFWNSQRSKTKGTKKNDIHKAIKRSSSKTLLDSTLYESLSDSKSKKKKNNYSFLLSPVLVAQDPNDPKPDDFTDNQEFISIHIPPPLSL